MLQRRATLPHTAVAANFMNELLGRAYLRRLRDLQRVRRLSKCVVRLSGRMPSENLKLRARDKPVWIVDSISKSCAICKSAY